MAILAMRPIFRINMPALQKMLRRVIGPSFSPPILASSAVQATDMPDYRQVCRDGTPLLFHDCGGHRQGARHGEQLSTLGPLIWVFGPRPRGPFFCLIGKLLRKNMVTRHAHDIVTAF